MSFVFDLLGNEFAQDDLLGEVLAADDDAILLRAACQESDCCCEDDKVKDPALSRPKTARQERGTSSDSLNNVDVPPHAALCGANRFSSQPKAASAIKAISAAGIAPARITLLLTIASPRKINSPRPPAPMAAAMVESPIEITMATRTPARMTPAASGNSTLNRS